MFTGIVETLGRVVSVDTAQGRVRLVIEAAAEAFELRAGDSVSVNGACLTVAGFAEKALCFDAVPETLARTSLGELAPGDAVHLERAMRADARFDGHIVQGHVDEAGSVHRLAGSPEAGEVRLHIRSSPAFAALLVEKGSVAVEGVSLTVAALHPDGFEVALIPHTLSVTRLGALSPGARVNLEADVIGKYVMRYLSRVNTGGGN